MASSYLVSGAHGQFTFSVIQIKGVLFHLFLTHSRYSVSAIELLAEMYLEFPLTQKFSCSFIPPAKTNRWI